MEVNVDRSQQSWESSFTGSVLVRQAGKTLLNRGYGDADRASGGPNTPETAFQIASISKQFAAAAILLLQERAVLSVHDRICAWVPHCPEEWEEITIHQLLTHTSGIGHWEDFPALDLCEPNTRENLIRIFQSAPLKFSPGSDWFYSSPSYVLVAHIIEQVSDEPYSSFLSANIFQPLGMHSTGAGNTAPHHDQQATGYAGDKPLASLFDLDSVGIGAGDIWSTTGDMERWDSALMVGSLLSEQSRQTMFAPHARVPPTPPAATAVHYGYGWVIAELQGHKLIFHAGGNAGFVSINAWFPDDDAVVIFLSNDDQIAPQEAGMRIASDILGIKELEPGFV